jgi:hypothetical protein
VGNSSVLGFTEAELGFFLALLCLVLWVASAVPPPPPKPKEPKPTFTVTAESAAVLQQKIDEMQRMVDSLKSPILPSCKSKGVAKGPLLALTAISAGSFRLSADTVNVSRISALTANDRIRAASVGCVHEIRLNFLRSLSAPDYEAARRHLQSLGLRLQSGDASDR